MENNLDLYSLFEHITWPASKKDLLEYSADNDFLEEFYELICNANIQDDYFFSSINDLYNLISSVEPMYDEDLKDSRYEEFSI